MAFLPKFGKVFPLKSGFPFSAGGKREESNSHFKPQAATATTAMPRSTTLAATATTGAVLLTVLTPAT